MSECAVQTELSAKSQQNMIKQQLRSFGVLNDQVLSIYEQIPREYFVPIAFQKQAYADMTIPLVHGQAMLNPKEEAKILQNLEILPHETLLEIGTGSGYMTALFAQLAAQVVSVEIFADLSAAAFEALNRFNIRTVDLQIGDAAAGWNLQRSFDVVMISAAIPEISQSWLQQINVGGRLFAIVGQAPVMQAKCWTRTGQHQWKEEIWFETWVPYLIHAEPKASFIF